MSEEGLSPNAENYLGDAIRAAVKRCRYEYNMSYAQAVGILELCKHDIMEEALGLSEDGEVV